MYNLDQFNPQDFILFIIVLVAAIIALFVVRRLLRVSFPYFFMGLLGLIIGLAVGSLVSEPLTRLPGNFGRWLPIIINVFVTVSILDLFLAQAWPAAQLLRKFSSRWTGEKTEPSSLIVIDTSVLIDGRIEEIIKTGFVMAKILIPQFILNELQAVADSEDSLKRAKGRKGLEVLDHLQHEPALETDIIDELTNSREAVDSKLIKVAKNHQAKILTVDFNLNKVAKIQNVAVLNINELTEAIKPILIPGEDIVVKIIQEGKEPGQGIGYLSDGTMIVVEGGGRLIGKEVPTEVVRIFQTVAGKMIFVTPKKNRRAQT